MLLFYIVFEILLFLLKLIRRIINGTIIKLKNIIPATKKDVARSVLLIIGSKNIGDKNCPKNNIALYPLKIRPRNF